MMLLHSRRLLLPGCIAFLIIVSLYWMQGSRFSIASIARPPPGPGSFKSSGKHAIDHLRAQAEVEYQKLLGKQVHDESSAARAYETRRGRRPPPGYAQWLAFAQEKQAIVVEDFFDRIYQDLAPFWAVSPKLLRQQANKHGMRIEIREGRANIISHYDAPWMNLWGDLIGTISQYLPNLPVPINDMDESRVIAPYEQIQSNMKAEKKTRRIVPKRKMVTTFSNPGEVDGIDPYEGMGDIWLHDEAYWNIAVNACAPHSAARSQYQAEFNYEKSLPMSRAYPEHSYHGYVHNWTLAKSPCDYPVLQQLHGSFVKPMSLSTSPRLIPIFGGSKLSVNNDILLPPAMYWSENERFDIGANDGGSWDFKHTQIIWRGAMTGGQNMKENWTRFQRHRFVSMMNASTVAFAESNPEGQAVNFVLPDKEAYNLSAESLAEWLKDTADVSFGDVLCYPEEEFQKTEEHLTECPYNAAWFDSGHKMPLTEELNYKYLPDIDGNSFSGRYRAFLMSTSLPIKATVYDEWHDSRLIPWKHFVPMDNTFTDLYGIMEYFMGSKGHEKLGSTDASVGRDDVAREIALSGKAWAEKVLRRDDMQVYVLRLLLEWARLLDDNRETLGWIPDGKK